MAASFTGIRLGEALPLTIGSLDGPPGERRLAVVGKGDKARALPLYPALEAVVDAYLASRATRFPGHDLTRPIYLGCLRSGGGSPSPMSVDQVKYLIDLASGRHTGFTRRGRCPCIRR